jgi:hypothetical protein
MDFRGTNILGLDNKNFLSDKRIITLVCVCVSPYWTGLAVDPESLAARHHLLLLQHLGFARKKNPKNLFSSL